LIVSFSTRSLRDSCQTLRTAELEFGQSEAQALHSLLADIEAMVTADELLAFYDKGARIDGEDSLSITFAPQCVARFEAVGGGEKTGEPGRIDWSTVRRLKLIFVGGHEDD
jgi:hypothetical protein